MPARRRPGSIYPRGDVWRVVVELDPDPLTGKRRRITRTAPTEAAAERIRAKLVTEVAEGTAQAPERRKLRELADAWLAHIEPNRSPSTMIGYRAKLDGYILPTLGDTRLDKLRPILFDGLYARLRSEGGQDKNPLSAQTVRHVHAICHAMCEQARRWGWIVRNPVEDATPPTVERLPITPPSAEEIGKLYDGALAGDSPDYELAMVVWLSAVLGPRRGETSALRWSDWDGDQLLIQRSLVVAGDRSLRVKVTKTGKARKVGLDATTARLLTEHRARAETRAEAVGVKIRPDGYIVSEAPDCGVPLHPDVLSKRFGRLAEKLGVKAHLHLLRHANISIALDAGVPVLTVADGVGHADARMTLDRYGHVLAVTPAAAEAIVGRIRPETAPPEPLGSP